MIGLLAAFAASSGLATLYSLSNVNSADDSNNFDATYSVTWRFNNTLDGEVDILRGQAGDLLSDEVYVFPPGGQNLWVRCTQNSGTNLNVGDSTGSWHSLTSSQSRSFGLSIAASGPDPDLISANVSFDIATDASGSNIVATVANRLCEVGHSGP